MITKAQSINTYLDMIHLDLGHKGAWCQGGNHSSLAIYVIVIIFICAFFFAFLLNSGRFFSVEFNMRCSG